MPDSAEVPTGKLQEVRREWEFQSGWVRAPLREIVFNDRLTKQARLVWLWLASIPNGCQSVSWGECETLLRCGTKARRYCISQLVAEGFISVDQNGLVTINDPYQVFDKKRKEIIDEIRDEWIEDIDFVSQVEDSTSAKAITIAEKKMDKEINVEKVKVEKTTQQQTTSSEKVETSIIVEAWNKNKPDNYSKIRSTSLKQIQCVKSHLKNLGLSTKDTELFIESVCVGLRKSDFWSSKVDQSGRNFNSVFGYGIPQDKKMKNIENLYTDGLEPNVKTAAATKKSYSIEELELIDTLRYSRLNLDAAKIKEDTKEIERWQNYVDQITESLNQYSIQEGDL